MSVKTAAPAERKTRRAITKLLKTEGPIDSAKLAERLGLTAMGVRQHLYALQREGLVAAEERPVPIGRPAKFWRLTREADRLFPEAYAELSVALSATHEKRRYGQEIAPSELVGLWAATNDMRNLILLGDPAVRLPAAMPLVG